MTCLGVRAARPVAVRATVLAAIGERPELTVVRLASPAEVRRWLARLR